MYKKQKLFKTTLNVNQSYEGERIEQKIERIVNNKEPIKDAADLIYTERKDGVQPDYNIRTDRWEIAIDAMDKVSKSNLAKREMSMGEKAYENMTKEQQTEFNTKFPKNKHNVKGPETGADTSDIGK